MRTFTPQNWYWRKDEEGDLFSSKTGAVVAADDADFAAWSADGSLPTVWPRDDIGAQSDAALHDVLAPYGLAVPGYDAVPVSVSSAQAKIALRRQPGVKGGKTLLDDVKAAVAAETTGEAQIWFDDARTWERKNPYVAALANALGLTAAQVDALFVAAGKVAA